MPINEQEWTRRLWDEAFGADDRDVREVVTDPAQRIELLASETDVLLWEREMRSSR